MISPAPTFGPLRDNRRVKKMAIHLPHSKILLIHSISRQVPIFCTGTGVHTVCVLVPFPLEYSHTKPIKIYSNYNANSTMASCSVIPQMLLPQWVKFRKCFHVSNQRCKNNPQKIQCFSSLKLSCLSYCKTTLQISSEIPTHCVFLR